MTKLRKAIEFAMDAHADATRKGNAGRISCIRSRR